MKIMNEYKIEKLNSTNLKDLLPIYENAFGYQVPIDFLLKKQDTSTFGLSFIGFIAYDNFNNPVGFYGVYPCYVLHQNKRYLVAQSGDTMTHNEHTGKGLFTKLALATYDFCKENGIHLVFGFPNKNSYPGFIKRLGWIHFDNMIPYLIRVKCIPWLRLKNTFKFPQSLHDRWCNFILSSQTNGAPFQSSCLTDETPIVDHSIDFFKYKTYGENHLIQLNGINIWVKFDDTFLLIGDFERCDENTFLTTIRSLKKLAFKMGLPHLRFQTSSGTWGERLFKKHGIPMEVKYPVGGINFTNVIPLEKMKFTGADNDTF